MVIYKTKDRKATTSIVPDKLAEADVQRALINAYGLRAAAASVNATMLQWWEFDFVRITQSLYLYEYEIKLTKSDFLRDFTHKKCKHLHFSDEQLRSGQDYPNYFYYAVPWYLKEQVETEIPDYAGLIVVQPKLIFMRRKKPVLDIHICKEAPKLHKNKASSRAVQDVLRDAMTRLLRRV